MEKKEQQMRNRELYELKQRAKQYYEDNGVPEKMEVILNNMFYDNPNDVYGHLANYFEGFALNPSVTKLSAREVIDSKGQPTVQTDIYCMVKNSEKILGSVILSNENIHPDHAKLEDREAEDEERQKSVQAAVGLIAGPIQEKVSNMDPTQQSQADKALQEVLEALVAGEEEQSGQEAAGDTAQHPASSPAPTHVSSKSKAKSPKGKNKGPAVVIIPDEPKEKFFCGCSALSATSQAICQAGANVRGVPLYKHIASLTADKGPGPYQLPLPMVTILAGGKATPGKLMGVKEFMVVPKPSMPAAESIKHISNIYNHVAKALALKGGASARLVNDGGALVPTLDRPEQGLDMIQEAITQLGLTPGQDFHIALNLAGQEQFDYEKGKYEVIQGQQKLSEDLADFWSELLGRYPAVIALIDPMRKQEKESWMRLCERVTEHCYVLGDQAHHRPARLCHQQETDDFKTNGALLRLENMTTITDVLEASATLQGRDNEVVIATCQGDSPDTLLVDLAVGVGARFLKVGAPCRGERVAKLARLVQIEAELQAEGSWAAPAEHTFKHIAPPPPPPEEEGGDAPADTTPADTNSTKKK